MTPSPNTVHRTTTQADIPSSSLSEEKKVENVQPDNNKTKEHKVEIVWDKLFCIIYLYLGGLYALYLILALKTKLYTFLWMLAILQLGGFGITAGSHRLWSHRSYKAKRPLRVLLAVFHAIAMQQSLLKWCRDHRVHHKFSETDADPFNVKRGLFFAHVGWNFQRKHPEVKRKGAGVDISDLKQDSILVWQSKYYFFITSIVSVIIPAFVPWYLWNEAFWTSWYVAFVGRHIYLLNMTWLVNSVAHCIGTKSFDKTMYSTENKVVAHFAIGEGFHNYHHVFPWDYKSAELGNYHLNHTTAFIDFFSKIGWAYDLKKVPVELIRKRAERTGDGSRNTDNAAQHVHQEPEEMPM